MRRTYWLIGIFIFIVALYFSGLGDKGFNWLNAKMNEPTVRNQVTRYSADCDGFSLQMRSQDYLQTDEAHDPSKPWHRYFEMYYVDPAGEKIIEERIDGVIEIHKFTYDKDIPVVLFNLPTVPTSYARTALFVSQNTFTKPQFDKIAACVSKNIENLNDALIIKDSDTFSDYPAVLVGVVYASLHELNCKDYKCTLGR